MFPRYLNYFARLGNRYLICKLGIGQNATLALPKQNKDRVSQTGVDKPLGVHDGTAGG